MKSKNGFSLGGLAKLANYRPEEPEAEPPKESKGSKTLYHGFTLAELEAEAGNDWQDIRQEQLETFAHALKTTQTRLQGERPSHYTKAAECAHCGPVWLWAGGKVQGCPWCINRAQGLPVPRPGLVQCRDCSHWIADAINPPGGLGSCRKNVRGLAWPWRELECAIYGKITP